VSDIFHSTMNSAGLSSGEETWNGFSESEHDSNVDETDYEIDNDNDIADYGMNSDNDLADYEMNSDSDLEDYEMDNESDLTDDEMNNDNDLDHDEINLNPQHEDAEGKSQCPCQCELPVHRADITSLPRYRSVGSSAV
jgi:hypothetical protein